MEQSRVALSVLFAALTMLLTSSLAQESATEAQGKYVKASPDLDIYYEEAGTGDPIIFIPGWTGSSYYFRQQVEHFSENYRAIAFDPRGQGRSSKTPENNNYTQHGHDLKAFMDALELKDVVLVAHSAGCKEAHAYFRAYGTDNTKAFVCIDHPPRAIIEEEGDWGTISDVDFFVEDHDEFAYDRANFTPGFTQALVSRQLTEAELNALSDMVMMTPTSVALQLSYDSNVADYTPEARMIDAEIPVLYVLAGPGWYEGWTQVARTWLANNAPNTEVVVIEAGHNLHWEVPEKFNAAVDSFLKSIE